MYLLFFVLIRVSSDCDGSRIDSNFIAYVPRTSCDIKYSVIYCETQNYIIDFVHNDITTFIGVNFISRVCFKIQLVANLCFSIFIIIHLFNYIIKLKVGLLFNWAKNQDMGKIRVLIFNISSYLSLFYEAGEW